MSELITFNTETAVQKGDYVQSIDIFTLVDENDPILKSVAPEFDFGEPVVNPVEFSSQLVETCRMKGGFGLAATQVGMLLRVFVMGSGEEYVAMFNPKILEQSDQETLIAEGCLSFPMLALKISRPKWVTVEYYDYNGERHESTFEGLSSHVVQHELDHLNGICYTDRAKPMSLKMGLKKRSKFNKLVDRYNLAQKVLKTVGK